MNSTKKLVDIITSISKTKSFLLLTIDGLGGSGKTLLAQELKQNLPNVSIVDFDDFYLDEFKRNDWDRLYIQVIKPLRETKTAKYQVMNPKTNKLDSMLEVKSDGIVIIDGVFALHERLINFYDYKIWVECDPDIAVNRGIKRDGEIVRDKWMSEWLPKELEYKEIYKPQNKADFIVKN